VEIHERPGDTCHAVEPETGYGHKIAYCDLANIIVVHMLEVIHPDKELDRDLELRI
jgi:hypothetical protein